MREPHEDGLRTGSACGAGELTDAALSPGKCGGGRKEGLLRRQPAYAPFRARRKSTHSHLIAGIMPPAGANGGLPYPVPGIADRLLGTIPVQVSVPAGGFPLLP